VKLRKPVKSRVSKNFAF